MKAIDVHAHLSTQRGYVLRKAEDLALARKYYKVEIVYRTEREMAEEFREADVKAILVGPISKSIEEAKENHDYLAQMVKDYPDVFISAWADINPGFGSSALQELDRCITSLGMIGPVFESAYFNIPYNDKSCYPFYEMCIRLKASILLYVGTTGLGAGSPGGGGYSLNCFRPIPYLDEVAANFPELTIIASRPAWPWQDEMIAILLHKSNVFNEIHGWLPKYLTQELKREIRGRLQDRFLFGSDYPTFTYERIFREWEAEGFNSDVMDKFLYKNAQRVLNL